LPFLIPTVELGKHFGGVVAVAEIDLRAGLQFFTGELHADLAELAILGGIGAVVAQNVIAADVLLRLADTQREIVGVDQGFPACV
jgi:hypothetical protein